MISNLFFLGKEGHEEPVACMKDVFQEMKDLERSGLDFNGFHLKIEWLVSKHVNLPIYQGL